MAATAAQSYRLWQAYDAVFAQKCLNAAEVAWHAANSNSVIYAPHHEIGGGPYNDNYVQDEFYWAAVELYLATGDAEYKTALMDSPHYLELPSSFAVGAPSDAGLTTPFTWGSVQGLGTVSLVLVPNGLPAADVAQARSNLVAAADVWLGNIEAQGYRLPMIANQTDGGYPWGSNSFTLNCMVAMAYAYDFTGLDKYFNGVAEGMDYLLGRNAMDQCYVTGYGARPLVNPHHRFWSHQADNTFPLAPAGAISGGPNTGFEDPVIQAAITPDTPNQKVFIDNIESWSSNEITINWNAPFAWTLAFLDGSNVGSPLQGYYTWAALNGVTGLPSEDDDGDGLENFFEYAAQDRPTFTLSGTNFSYIQKDR
jgi:endoglucanase